MSIHPDGCNLYLFASGMNENLLERIAYEENTMAEAHKWQDNTISGIHNFQKQNFTITEIQNDIEYENAHTD